MPTPEPFEDELTPWVPLLPTAYLAPDLRIRELPPDVWYRLWEAGGFFEDIGKIPAPSAGCRIVVGEVLPEGLMDEEGHWKVVAYCPCFNAVHAEPLSFHPDFRHHPHLQKAFLGGLVRLLQASAVQFVWATVADAQPGIESILKTLQFEKVEGTLWTGRIPPPAEGGQ